MFFRTIIKQKLTLHPFYHHFWAMIYSRHWREICLDYQPGNYISDHLALKFDIVLIAHYRNDQQNRIDARHK